MRFLLEIFSFLRFVIIIVCKAINLINHKPRNDIEIISLFLLGIESFPRFATNIDCKAIYLINRSSDFYYHIFQKVIKNNQFHALHLIFDPIFSFFEVYTTFWICFHTDFLSVFGEPSLTRLCSFWNIIVIFGSKFHIHLKNSSKIDIFALILQLFLCLLLFY